MFMFGGYGGSGRLDDFWEFDFGEACAKGKAPGEGGRSDGPDLCLLLRWQPAKFLI